MENTPNVESEPKSIHFIGEVPVDKFDAVRKVVEELGTIETFTPLEDFESLPMLNEPLNKESFVEFAADFFGNQKGSSISVLMGMRVFEGMRKHIINEHHLGGCDCWLRLEGTPSGSKEKDGRNTVDTTGFVKYAHELSDQTAGFKDGPKTAREIHRIYRHLDPNLRDDELDLVVALFKRAARKRIR